MASITSNGHISPIDVPLSNDDAPYDSESELSEVANPSADGASAAGSSKSQSEGSEQEDDASGSDIQGASDDGDYDVDEDPVAADVNPNIRRSESSESRRPTKRKLGVEDDEHIKANPELYGLRRSVSFSTLG